MEYLVIQVEEGQVVAARFGVGGRSLNLAGAAEFRLGDGLDLADAAGRIAAGTTGSPQVVLCLSPSLFAQRRVELPLKDARKVREVLPAHLQGEIALPPEEAVFEALPSAEGSFLALWAKRSELAQAIALFREAGIEPRFVTTAPLAWHCLPGSGGSCLISDGSAIAAVSDGRLQLVRPLSGAALSQQLAATQALLAAAGVAPPSRLLYFGGLTEQPELPDKSAMTVERLELPSELAAAFRNGQAFQQLAGLYAVALACHEGVLADFRRNDLAWTAGNIKVRRQMRTTALLAGLTLLLLFGQKGMQYRQASADLASLNRSIAAIYHDIFPGRSKAVDELAEVKGEIRKLSGVAGTSGFLDLLKQLAEAKGGSINGLYEAELEGRSLRVKGDARSAQAANEFKAALAPLTASVELGEVKSRPDGTVTFTLVATLKEVKP